MKKQLIKSCAVLMAIFIVIACLPAISVSAASTQPTTYSKQYNSGQRDVVCTSLSGTSASSYYTGSYTYENLSGLSASSLKSSLSTLMRSTHTKITSYNDCKNYSDQTDCQNEDGTVVLLYTSYVASMSDWISGSTGWNREHVWPQSLGGGNTSNGGADLHHIRPDDVTTNSKRGNNKFGEVSSGSQATGSSLVNGMSGGTYSGGYFEPHDNVKGDVARICLYVYVRWGSDWGADSITEVFQSVDVLLDWMEMDPVDTWEMGRNEVVQNIQGNRNVFIDYPEYAWLMFGEEVPSNMATPSGRASNGTAGGNQGGNTDSGNQGNQGGNTDGGNDNTTTTYPTIAEIKNGASGQYTTEGVVVAKNAQSYLLNDGTDSILVFLKSSPSVSIGDKVRVTGSTSSYGGAVQFGQGTTHTKIGTAQVNHPVAKALSGADCDSYLNNVTVDYVKVIGTLSISGNYVNLDIDGATITGSVTYPAESLSAYSGKEVEVMGYVTGVTGSTAKYLNIMMTSIKEYDPNAVCNHATTKVVGAKEATCVEDGYSGDTYCASCDEKLAVGNTIAKNENHNWTAWSALNDTTEIRHCKNCDKYDSRTIGSTDDPVDTETETEAITHNWSEWILIDIDLEMRVCQNCGQYESRTVEATTEAPTNGENAGGNETEESTSAPAGSEQEKETSKETSKETEPKAETNAPQENGPITIPAEEKGGCGSSIAGSTIIIAITSLAAFGMIRKKKED